jgi:hypothetical protein
MRRRYPPGLVAGELMVAERRPGPSHFAGGFILAMRSAPEGQGASEAHPSAKPPRGIFQ